MVGDISAISYCTGILNTYTVAFTRAQQKREWHSWRQTGRSHEEWEEWAEWAQWGIEADQGWGPKFHTPPPLKTLF